jgi:2-haloacid dehalogenase
LTAVIFDLGGVLIDWDPRHLYRRLFDGNEEAMERFLADVTTVEWNARQDGGRSLEEATSELIAAHPQQADLIRAYYAPDTWREMIAGSIEESVGILSELKERGVRLFALSNWSAETFPRVRHEFDFLGWFEGIVLSGHEGVTKPAEAIYRILLDRHGLSASEVIFVDDSEHNVQQARQLGMDAIRFTSPADLRRELEVRGLLKQGPGLHPAATS